MENDASNVTVEGTVAYFSHETEKYIKASQSPICVDWKITTGQNMTGQSISSGRAYTTSDIDYTVKVGSERIVTKMRLTSLGRGWWLESVHILLLPVYGLRHERDKSHWEDKNSTS